MTTTDRAPAVAWLTLLAVLLAMPGCEQQPPDEPTKVHWDKNVCASCSMHLAEPGFAAQIQTPLGETLFFDDPGCLFLHIEREKPEIHMMWFHHVDEDRWIAGDKVGFVRKDKTPMGFGVGAVDAADGELTLDEARAHVLAGVADSGTAAGGADDDGHDHDGHDHNGHDHNHDHDDPDPDPDHDHGGGE